jgi:uncharacterized protein YndB with AHSA1/START domain
MVSFNHQITLFYLMSLKDIHEFTSKELVTTRMLNFPATSIYQAWTQPNILKQWWGPNGFTSTFHEFDPQPGGYWRFTLHGPDGANYENESQFIELKEPSLVSFIHLSQHQFQILATFDEINPQKTKCTFRMIFETAEECNKFKPFVLEPNEQNLDRLQAVLEKETH